MTIRGKKLLTSYQQIKATIRKLKTKKLQQQIKAFKNETAEKFQAIVCDEILPQIRKTGYYQVKPLTQLEILAQSTQILIEQDKAIKELTANQTKQAEDLQGIRDVITLSTVSWREDTKNLLVKIARKTGDVQIVSDLWSDAYKLLDSRMGVNVKQRLVNLRKNMAIEGASKSKQSNTNTLDVIGLDKKLVEGFVAIVKEMAIKAGVA